MRRGTRQALLIVIVFFSGFVCLGVLLARWRWFELPSSSMEPTIRKGERFLAHCYRFLPERGQLVVYRNDEGLLITKRVLAVGGDTIEIREQHVLVNGVEVSEPYVIHTLPAQPANPYMNNLEPQRIPEGHFFVLGDNRDVSYDSRQPEIGAIEDARLLCKVTKIVWSSDPTRRWKSVQ